MDDKSLNLNSIKEKSNKIFLEENENEKNNYNSINELDINKIAEEKDKRLKELEEKYEKEHKERYKIELKLLNLKQDIEKEKIECQLKKNKNFLEKSEVVEKWEKFALNDITENFVDFSPIQIYHLVSNLFFLCKELLNNILTEKYNQLLNCFNIPSNSRNLESIQLRLKPFILDNMSDIIFNEKDSFIFLNNLKKDFKTFSSEIIKNKENEFNDLINDNSFKTMIECIKNLILFAMFNEPILSFNIEKNYLNRKIETIKVTKNNKDNYIIVNEPGINDFEAIILLNPPITKSGNEIAELNDLKKIIINIEDYTQNTISNNNINNINDINDDIEIEEKRTVKSTSKYSGEISIKKKKFYEICSQLDTPIISQIERIKLQYRNKTVSNNNKDSSSNYYTNPLSQRMNKSLNHKLIKSNKFIDGSSKEYDYIHSNCNDDNNDKIVYAHYSYQVKGKYDCDDISSEIRKNKITFNENDYKRILKNVYSNDFFPKHNTNINNNNTNNIYQIFQIRNSEKKNNKNSKNKKISQKKLITKKSSNCDKGNSNKKIISKTNKTNNTSNKSNIINKSSFNNKSHSNINNYRNNNKEKSKEKKMNEIKKKKNNNNNKIKIKDNNINEKNNESNNINYEGITLSSPGKENILIKNIERPSTGTTKSSTYFNIDTETSIPKKDIKNHNLNNLISLNQTNRVISQVGFYKNFNSPKYFYVNQLDNNNSNNINEKNDINKRFIVKIAKNNSKKVIKIKNNINNINDIIYNKNKDDKSLFLGNTIRNSSLLKLKKIIKSDSKRTKSPNIFIKRSTLNHNIHYSKRSFQ